MNESRHRRSARASAKVYNSSTSSLWQHHLQGTLWRGSPQTGFVCANSVQHLRSLVQRLWLPPKADQTYEVNVDIPSKEHACRCCTSNNEKERKYPEVQIPVLHLGLRDVLKVHAIDSSNKLCWHEDSGGCGQYTQGLVQRAVLIPCVVLLIILTQLVQNGYPVGCPVESFISATEKEQQVLSLALRPGAKVPADRSVVTSIFNTLAVDLQVLDNATHHRQPMQQLLQLETDGGDLTDVS
mmetsp:Transcript_23408/g.54470  ORF Transcript_23408/g.54470 Transcript_23408/m.54470 type:complete len:240 (+) Transcript_23408:99-818(+)